MREREVREALYKSKQEGFYGIILDYDALMLQTWAFYNQRDPACRRYIFFVV